MKSVLALLFVFGLLGAAGAAEATTRPDGMVLVRGGLYTPLYRSATEPVAVPVGPFYLDATPVTNADFLAFVRANPAWRRSRVRPLFVDDGYLQHWAGDTALGPGAGVRQPVVNVSWFAAMAYARWRGKRLPTVAEWERAAAAGTAHPDGRREPAFARRIIEWYSRPLPPVLPNIGATPPNYWGARDLHGLVWEWTTDFNSDMVGGDSRSNRDRNGGLFCGAGAVGSADFEDYAAFLRFAYRGGLEARYTVPSLGFRLALDAR